MKSPMRIVYFAAPWTRDLFACLDKELSTLREIEAKVTLSIFEEVDETGFNAAFTRDLTGRHPLEPLFSADVEDDIIARCRLLRLLPDARARRAINAAAIFIDRLFADFRPTHLMSEACDNYVHHVAFLLAERRGVVPLAYMHSFINGYMRFSILGEAHDLREVGEEEIDAAMAELTNRNYLPSNLVSIKRNILRRYFSVMLKNIARVGYFYLRRIRPSERYNYHYWSSSLCFRKEHMHFVPQLGLGDPDWRDKLEGRDLPVLFLPLQHVPEATIDYWTQERDRVAYSATLERIFDYFEGKATILVKEHPGVYGFRTPRFYEVFRNRPDVVMAPPNDPSNDCSAAADGVLVWTSTVGFEAALRGQKVIYLTRPYYFTDAPNETWLDFEAPVQTYMDFLAADITLDEPTRRDMLRHVLSGCVPGYVRSNGTFDPQNAAHLKEVRQLAEALARNHV